MVQNERFYMQATKADLIKVNGDIKMFFWYSALKDYAKRYGRDKRGFVRVCSQTFFNDYGIDRVKAWRYNKRLEDKGLVEIDRIHRGGRTWIGFRII